MSNEIDGAYSSKAREIWVDVDLEIDDDAKVSISDDGAWVAAWVWVDKHDVEELA